MNMKEKVLELLQDKKKVPRFKRIFAYLIDDIIQCTYFIL